MDGSSVSVCLLSWRRPANMAPIVDSLHDLDFVDEILVWNNDPDVDLRLEGSKVRVVRSPENMGCAGRYRCIAEARNEVIYTQDDDALVNDVAGLREAFLRDPTRLTFGLTRWHYDHRDLQVIGECEVGLLGWGAFLRRSWAAGLDELPAEVRESALFRRQADTYFSVGLYRRHTALLGDIHMLDGHSDPDTALWLLPDSGEAWGHSIREALRLARERHRPHLPPRWNVVVPCRNQGRFLGESVRSVLLNGADAVVTIVDDASDDDSVEVAADLADRHSGVRLVRLPARCGVGGAVNRGIASQDSAFVVRVDADDRIGHRYLRAADDVLSDGANVANPDALLFGAEEGRWCVPADVTPQMLRERNAVHRSAAFPRSLWAQVGGFDEEPADIAHDYDFWTRLARVGARIRAVPGDHYFHRRYAAR